MKRLAMLWLVACGCPICPDSSMSIVGGRDDGTVRGGDRIQLRATYGDWVAGPGHCNGLWYVNHVLGGTPGLGEIDRCGLYRAPTTLPDNLQVVIIEASDWQLPDGCADCCSYAVRTLEPVP